MKLLLIMLRFPKKHYVNHARLRVLAYPSFLLWAGPIRENTGERKPVLWYNFRSESDTKILNTRTCFCSLIRFSSSFNRIKFNNFMFQKSAQISGYEKNGHAVNSLFFKKGLSYIIY